MGVKKHGSGISIEDFHYEILITIFMKLNLVELSIASMVCKSWNEVCRTPSLWAKLDLTQLSSNAFNIPFVFGAWKHDMNSINKLTTMLKYALSLSNYNTTCLVFNYFVYLTDSQLITIAERTPNLRRLVFPFQGSVSEDGIESAMKLWRGLESIVVTNMVMPCNVFSAINKYCANISQMKFTSKFDVYEADLMIQYTPNLKRVSIRNIMVNLTALIKILTSLQILVEVNICHSLIWDRVGGVFELYTIRDLRSHLSLASLQKLLFCNGRRCLKCKNKKNKDLRRASFEHMVDVWRQDEIRSLAH
ncbi:F-box/LRR-repeat protein [Trifolium repens]|nr:F-box/LRR-repeat protein [Trifolium repens]